jgi:hypothetical protein
MADIVLNVPLVGQKLGYDGKPLTQPDARGALKQHGFMACWYAGAEMVSYYYRAGPRNGLPHVWKPDRGLTLAAIDQLASAEGLKRVRPDTELTRDGIYALLKVHGPIWAAGHFLDGHPTAGHVIVLTGVQGPFVLYNDPWEPKAKKRTSEWVVQHLLPLPNALLAKDQGRS